MASRYNGKIYKDETELYNDFSNNHPEIHPDDISDRMDFGGEVEEIEVCPVCGGLEGKHTHKLGDGRWSKAYPD